MKTSQQVLFSTFDQTSAMNVNTRTDVSDPIYDSTGFIKVNLVRPDGNAILDDRKSLVVVDYPHYAIHEGMSYVATDAVTLNNNDEKIYLMISPNTDTEPHMLVSTRWTGEGNISICEDSTASDLGSILSSFNRNRRNINIPETLLKFDPTMVGNGTLCFTEYFGAGQRIGGESRNTLEFILKKNTQYVLYLVSETASNDMSILFDWYEEI